MTLNKFSKQFLVSTFIFAFGMLIHAKTKQIDNMAEAQSFDNKSIQKIANLK